MKNRLTMIGRAMTLKPAFGLLIMLGLGVLMSGTSFASGKAEPDYGDLTTGRFRVVAESEGAILRDTQTGLEWQRCPVGMQWSLSACVGRVWRNNWNNVKDVTAAGGFRTPTIDELKTLIPMDHQQFPESRTWFWSSSPDKNFSPGAWLVDFTEGFAFSYGKSGYFPVRLVRAGR
jgi:hypothetical protein